MSVQFFSRCRCAALFIAAVMSAWLTVTSTSRANDNDAGDIEIIRAFQERYHAAYGSYVYWGAKLNTQTGDNYPSEGDYAQSTLNSHVGTFIWNYLRRDITEKFSSTGTGEPPLFFLEDDNLSGAKTWGDIRKKTVLISAGGNPELPEKRRLILDVLRRQRILATPLVLGSPESKKYRDYTPLDSGADMSDAVDEFDGEWDSATADLSQYWWRFQAGTSGNEFKAGFDVTRGKFQLRAHLGSVPFTPVLSMQRLNANWEPDDDLPKVIADLDAKGFYLSPNQGYFKYFSTDFDPGNLFAVCSTKCDVHTYIECVRSNEQIANLNDAEKKFSFALAYPRFKYLPSNADGDCCGSCVAGGSQVRLNSVHINIPLGTASLGEASASLLVDSPHVHSGLWHPHSLQVGMAPGFEAVLHADGYLRQAYGPGIIADLSLRSGGDGYEIAVYDRTASHTPDATTGLISLSGQTLKATHKFIDPDHTTGPAEGVRQLSYQRVHGSVTDESKFKTEAQTGNGTPLTTLTHPGSHTKESVRTTWTVDGSNDRLDADTETRLTYDVSNAVIGKEVRTWRWGSNGRVLDQIVIDPDGAALTTTYTYVDDDPLRVSAVVRPDGSWEQFTYDDLRRVTKHRWSRLDKLPDCEDAECRVETITWPTAANGEITTWVTTDANVEVARRYKQDLSDGYKEVVCTVQGASITASTNLVTTTKWFEDGWFQRRPALVTAPDGTLTKYTYTLDPTTAEPATADTLTTEVETGAPSTTGDAVEDGSRNTRITNKEGHVIYELTKDIASEKTLASRSASSADGHGRPVTWTHHDTTTEILNYDCCGLSSRTDRQGVVTNYTRDQVVSRVPAGGGDSINAMESSTGQPITYRNASGAEQTHNLTYIQREEGLTSRSFRKSADVTLSDAERTVETARTVRDAAGRVISSRDAMGNVTSFSEECIAAGSAKHLRRTTTFPGGGTRVEEYYQDGSLKCVTGTAVHGQKFEYGADSIGTWTKTTLLLTNDPDDPSGEWSKSWTDMAGRAKKTETSSGAVTTRYFNNLGQLKKTEDPDNVTTLSEYDSRGRLTRTALDVDRDGVVDEAAGDRISKTVSTVSTHGSTDVHRTTTSVWTAGNTGSAGSEVAKSEISLTGLQSWSTAAGLESYTVRTLPSAGAWTETTTAPDNTQTVSAFAGGRLTTVTRKNTSGATLSSTTTRYDAHGRVHSVVDPLGGITTYTYNADDSVASVTSPDPDGAGALSAQVTSTTYTVLGQTNVVTLPGGKTIDNDYASTGEVSQVAGTAAPAVAYTYDYAGRMLTMVTQPGGGSAATTSWTYHSTSGRLASKTHAASSGTETYTRTAGGRPLTKTNGRNNLITYLYGSTTSGTVLESGDLTDITYSDSTPPVAYTYDRLGRMTTATRDGITRTVNLTLHGQQESESWADGPLDGLAVDPGFDSLRRREALAVTGPGDTVAPAAYGYNSVTGELATIGSTGPGVTGTLAAHYAYRTGTRQVETVTFKNDTTTRLTQTRAYDDLHRLTGVTSVAGSANVFASTHTLDAAGRRSRTVLADGTWWAYTYDDHGQVTAAQRRKMAGSSPADTDPVLPGQGFSYVYDGLGNRTSASQGDGSVTASAAVTYTPSTANKYSTVAHNRTAIVTGTADSAASVTINSSAAPRQGPWWGQSNATSSGSSAAWLDFSIDATLTPDTDHSDMSILVPPSSVTPEYDDDGNLEDDGLHLFTWDAENRLTSVTTRDTLLPAGAPMYRVTYQYDDAGRRIAQTVEAHTTSSGPYKLVSRRCFLFDGWNCVAEYNYVAAGTGASRRLYRSQVWGPDIGGGGGAGGLLVVRRHTGPLTSSHFATHDGNGNVTALVNAATGTESARYDYDAFGNLLNAGGTFATENPYRFSSQFTDDVTGLLYYGYRHYDPVHGRWLSRDPVGEAGGANLYGFIGNDPVNDTDVLGMISSREATDQALQFHFLLLQIRNQRDMLKKYVEQYGDPRDPDYRKKICEHLQKIQQLNAQLPGERERMSALMEELGNQEGEHWDITRWAGFREDKHGPQGVYSQALAELAALVQEGIVSGDVLRAAIVAHAAVDSAFLEADMGEIDAQRVAGITAVTLNAALMASSAGVGGVAGGLSFLGSTGGYYGAKAMGAGEGLAAAIGFLTGGTPLALSSMLSRGGGAKTALPELRISSARYPDLAENILNAQRAGHPDVLTHGGAAVINANRNAALHQPYHDFVPNVGRGLTRDEYPFASSLQGGAGSWVGHIPASQNHAQGALIKNFNNANNIVPGSQYRVVIVP